MDEDQQIILPSAPWKTRWDLLILVLIVYNAVALPVHVGFDRESTGVLWVFEATMPLIFIVDVRINFRTAYHGDDGALVSDRSSIARRCNHCGLRTRGHRHSFG